MSKNNNGVFWEKRGKMGNWIAEWVLLVEFEGVQWEFCRITQFVKGEYCLPQMLFPRDGFYNRQKTRSLQSAKHKCEQAFMRFAELISPTIKYKK